MVRPVRVGVNRAGQAANEAVEAFTRSGGNGYRCLVCRNNVTYKGDVEYRRHFNRVHIGTRMVPNDNFIHCPTCGLIYNGQLGLERHTQLAHAQAEEENVEQQDGVDNNQPNNVAGGEANPLGNENNNNNNGEGGHHEEGGEGGAPAQEQHQADEQFNEGDIDHHAELLGRFHSPLNRVESAWQEQFYRTVLKLLDEMARGDDSKTYIATLAFFLLPGIITYKILMDRRENAKTMLGRIHTSNNAAMQIIDDAMKLYKLGPLTGPDEMPPRGALQATLSSAVKMWQNGRIGTANRAAREAEEILTGAANQAPPRQAPTKEQIRALLVRLYPKHRSDELDSLPEDNSDLPAGIVITGAEALKAIKHLDKGKAHGASAWTAHLPKFMSGYGNETDTAAFGDALAAVFNRIYAGNMPKSVQAMWTRTRLVMLPKDVPPGAPPAWRPLGIGDILYRLMMAAAYRLRANDIGRYLMPNQLAVGVQDGCAIAAKVAQMHFQDVREGEEDDEELSTASVSVDAENCYGDVSVVAAFNGMREAAPDLLRVLLFTHQAPSPVVHSDGTVIGQREIGFRQGCPGSSSNASLALKPVYDDMLKALRETEREFREEKGVDVKDGDLLAFVDDVEAQTVLGVATRFAPKVPDIYKEHGLTVVVRKSWIRGRRINEAVIKGNIPIGWKALHGGGTTLGIPIGEDDYIRAELRDAATKSSKSIKLVLNRLPVRLGLQLTTLCTNQSMDYVLRAVEPHLSIEASEIIDDHTNQSLSILSNLSKESAGFGTLRSLPMAMGGLGIYSHQARTEAAALVCRARTYAHIAEHRRNFLPLTVLWPMITIGERQGVADASGVLSVEEGEALTTWDDPKQTARAARKVLQEVDSRTRTAFIETLDLNEQVDQSKLAFFLSCHDKIVSRWIRSYRGLERGVSFFPDAAVRNMLRLRFLAMVEDRHGVPIKVCPRCSDRVHNADSVAIGPSHALCCRKQNDEKIARHDNVKHVLRDELKKHVNKPGLTVSVEERLVAAAGAQATSYKMDLVLRAQGGYVRYIDVAVADAGARKYVVGGSWEREQRAADIREREKRSKFANLAPNLPAALFVPFVIESSGRPGKAAREFLRELQLPGAVVFRLLEHIAVLLAVQGGKDIDSLRRAAAFAA